MSFPAPARPLQGLKVVETPGGLATRYCGRLLAVMGADVVTVAGDGERPPDRRFAAWLDQGKTAVPTLAAGFDALGDGRVLAIAGQTADAVAAVAPQLAGYDVTLLALTWFDGDGPYAGWRVNDALMQAMTGCAYAFGLPEGPPILAQGHAPQLVGGLVGFIAALGGLMNPARAPRRIEANVFEAALCFSETGAVATWASGLKSHRLGVNRYVPTYPGTIYETADGHVGVTALTPAQWLSLCGLLERPDLAADARFRSTYLRLPIADEVDAILVPAFRARATDWWAEAGDRLRIPITPALPPGELPGHPHWRARASFAALDGVEAPTLPYRFTFDGARVARPAGGAAGPLAGVRVADFSMGWAGPLATRYLGDLGADVLKIESHARPDWWRGWEAVEAQDPPPHEVQRNFMAVNRSKRGLDLDLGDPGARASAEAIVSLADVVIDNQGPNVMDRLGLGPADQRRLNPAAVSVSMPPFGRTGPLAGLRAYGSTVEQASGMPFVNGHADWAPSQQHVAYGDAAAGLYGAAAALVGLYARERWGGAEIDLCQVECLFQLGADAIIAEQAAGARSRRSGSRRRSAAPSTVARTTGEAEAWLAVCLDDDAAWSALARTIGRADWAADPALATLAGRQAREEELEAAIADWAAGRDRREAAQTLQIAGVAAAPVLAVHDLSGDPHLEASGFWVVQDRRYVGRHLTPAPPFRYDGARPTLTRPAPVLGEHTQEALDELGIHGASPPA